MYGIIYIEKKKFIFCVLLGKRIGVTKTKRTDFAKNGDTCLFFGKNQTLGEVAKWRKSKSAKMPVLPYI